MPQLFRPNFLINEFGGTNPIKTKQYFGPCIQIWRRTGQLLDLVLPNKQELEQILNVGGIKQFAGCGLGCVLIRRDVLEQIEFTTDPASQVSADSTFYRDVFLAGGEVWCDLGVWCRHLRRHL